MSLTADAKDELARLQVDGRANMRAETSALLRFAGGLHLVSGHIVIEAEVDSPACAARLQNNLSELYRAVSSVVVVGATGLNKTSRYVVRVVEDADSLAQATGLVDQRGRPVRGLLPQMVSSTVQECISVWRGAFLARGSLIEPARSAALEVTCPGPEAALALVGLARRFNVNAKSREVRGVDRVVVREGECIATLLSAMGAQKTLAVWASRREKREKRGIVNRLANFDDANMRRSTRAAVLAAARVKRAFEILGDDLPEHLLEAGKLRMENKQASLEELGRMSNPVLTKDAVAGRIRRLLAMADKRAAELGIEDTESGLTSEISDS